MPVTDSSSWLIFSNNGNQNQRKIINGNITKVFQLASTIPLKKPCLIQQFIFPRHHPVLLFVLIAFTWPGLVDFRFRRLSNYCYWRVDETTRCAWPTLQRFLYLRHRGPRTPTMTQRCYRATLGVYRVAPSFFLFSSLRGSSLNFDGSHPSLLNALKTKLYGLIWYFSWF